MRVTVETRKAYVMEVNGKRRRFWTEAGAYYALAKSLLGPKYIGPLKAAEECGADEREFLHRKPDDVSEDAYRSRVDRARELFVREYDDHYHEPHEVFESHRWQAYVRRVARKMRAMDKARRP